MWYRNILVVLTLSPITAAVAGAQVVYNGGQGAYLTDGWEMSGTNEAVNFILPTAATITSAQITTTYQGEGNVDPTYGFRGQFNWALFTNADGLPGTLIESGSSIPTRTTQTIEGPDLDVSQWTFAITPIVLADSTTYWLSVYNTDSTGSYARNGFYWEASGEVAPGTPPSAYQPNGTGPWIVDPAIDAAGEGYGNRLSLTLDGTVTTTPEPASFILLGTGLLGLVPVVRRRRNR